MTKEEFAANEIKEFCKYVMHPDSDLHKDAECWIKERLQPNSDYMSKMLTSFVDWYNKERRQYEVPNHDDVKEFIDGL